jgi:hypothetical protein
MQAIIIRSGEYLTQVAARMGFDAEAVWNDPKNAELKQRREHMDILQTGDIVYVPDPAPQGLPIEKGASNDYVGDVPRVKLRFVLRWGEHVLDNQAYVVRGLGDPVNGTSDGEGKVALEVPVHVREISLYLPDKSLVFPVAIGDMDPIGEASGVEKRLANLGYLAPAADADAAEALAEAVRRFQTDRGLSVTSVVDDATRAELVRAHGC